MDSSLLGKSGILVAQWLATSSPKFPLPNVLNSTIAGSSGGSLNSLNRTLETTPLLCDVAQNAFMKEIFIAYQNTTLQLAETKKQYENLMDEFQKLKYELQASQNADSRINYSPPPTSSRSQSLSPSDSISQVIYRAEIALQRSNLPLDEPRSAQRPQHLPVAVLWNLEDCRSDEHIGPKRSNTSRPPMHLVIRNANGTVVDRYSYNNIRSDTAALCAANLHKLPTPTIVPPQGIRDMNVSETRTLKWYKLHHPHVLNAVIKELERMHQVLQYCSGHWKAEHMLTQHLNSRNLSIRNRIKRQKARDMPSPSPALIDTANEPQIDTQGSALGDRDIKKRARSSSQEDETTLLGSAPKKHRTEIVGNNP